MSFAPPSTKEKFWNERLFLKDLQQQDDKLKRIQYLGENKKKVDTCEAQWGNFLWKLLNFCKCNTKSCPPTQKEPFSLSSRLLSIFFWALFHIFLTLSKMFDVMLWGCRRHDFSKDVTRKHFFTAWLSSILIFHVQNLFDENIFLPFQLQKYSKCVDLKNRIV